MSFRSTHLDRLGKRIRVPIRPDENGYLGRECPVSECEGYFLVRPGTGLTGPDLPCHCPYCGHAGPANTFFTKEQIEYARSVALRQISTAIRNDLKQMEFNIPAKGAFGIGISMRVQPGTPLPIRRYREKALETFVTCAHCTLDYGVYGVFAFCPDCGEHNSLQILERNLDLTKRQVELAQGLPDAALSRHLLEDALENCVSALDGFGREAIRVRAAKSAAPDRAGGLSFQNLERASTQLAQLFGVDVPGAVGDGAWHTAHRGFMKRHVVAHRAGVVDQAYVDQTGDLTSTVGRMVPLAAAEVIAIADAVLSIGRTLVALLPAAGA